MFKWLRHRKTSIIYVWFISYFIALVFPVVINFMVYVPNSRTMKKQITESNSMLLNNLCQRMDNLADLSKRLAIELIYNRHVTDYAGGYTENVNQTKYFIKQELETYKLSYGYISDFFIYFKDTDSIISPDVSTDSSIYYQSNMERYNFSYEEWKKLFGGYYKGNFIFIPTKKNMDIAYIFSYSPNGGQQVAFNVVTILSEDLIKKEMTALINNSYSDILLLDGYNKVIASVHNTASGTFQTPQVRPEDGIYYMEIDGTEYAVSDINSNITDWKYVCLSSVEEFWKSTNNMWRFFIFSLVFCVLAGVGLIWILVKKNYKPVNEILERLKSSGSINKEERSNEYKVIEQAMDEALMGKENADAQLEKQQNILRVNFLAHLIKGDIMDSIPLDEAIDEYNIIFPSDKFCVFVIYIEDTNRLFEDDPMAGKIDKNKVSRLIIVNIVSELVNRKHKGYVVEVDEMLACLVCFEEDSRDFNPELDINLIMIEAREFIQSHFNILFTVTIGSIKEGIVRISESYHEALEAMEYKMIMGLGKILNYNDIKAEISIDYFYPIEKEQQLINCIKSGDIKRADALTDSILDKNLNGKVLSMQFVKLLIFDIFGTMLKAVSDLGLSEEDGLIKNINPIDEIIKCDTIEDVREKLHDILKLFCEAANKKRTPMQKSLVEDVKLYINTNYADCELSVASTAQHFSVSPNYLSHSFKENTKNGLLNYIHFVRIEKAKEFLKKAPYTNIEKVAIAVGYTNLSTFNRAFLKVEGTTPGRWVNTFTAQ